MFHINPESLVTKTDKLLYNIQELLLAQRAQPEKIIEEIKGLACKFCGGTHENKGLVMTCARKHKKVS